MEEGCTSVAARMASAQIESGSTLARRCRLTARAARATGSEAAASDATAGCRLGHRSCPSAAAMSAR